MTNRELERKLRTAMEHAAPHEPPMIGDIKEEEKGVVIPMRKEKGHIWGNVAAAAVAALVIGGCVWGGLSLFGGQQGERVVAGPGQPTPAQVQTVEPQAQPTPTVEPTQAAQPTPTAQPTQTANQTPPPSGGGTDYVTADQALHGALLYLGLESTELLYHTEKFDYDDGRAVYEVEVCYQGTEYDCEVDAVTCQVLKYEQDWCEHPHHEGNHCADSRPHDKNHHTAPTATPSPTAAPSAGSDSYIDPDAALAAAYTHAGVDSADARRVKCELDREDWGMVYEVEFIVGDMEYEYEIDAVTGSVLDYDWDRAD